MIGEGAAGGAERPRGARRAPPRPDAARLVSALSYAATLGRRFARVRVPPGAVVLPVTVDASGFASFTYAARVVVAHVGGCWPVERADRVDVNLIAGEREDRLVDDDHRGLGIGDGPTLQRP
jgi:hypothetical protein